jgi:hypothetical protein
LEYRTSAIRRWIAAALTADASQLPGTRNEPFETNGRCQRPSKARRGRPVGLGNAHGGAPSILGNHLRNVPTLLQRTVHVRLGSFALRLNDLTVEVQRKRPSARFSCSAEGGQSDVAAVPRSADMSLESAGSSGKQGILYDVRHVLRATPLIAALMQTSHAIGGWMKYGSVQCRTTK